jgi:hypothetical protein
MGAISLYLKGEVRLDKPGICGIIEGIEKEVMLWKGPARGTKVNSWKPKKLDPH